MSEIIVRGFEVGKTCKECKLQNEFYGEYFCMFMPEPINYEIRTGIRSEYCPAENIQPHGRLIDADALIEEMLSDDEGRRTGDIDVLDIRAMPTIIPASEDLK